MPQPAPASPTPIIVDFKGNTVVSQGGVAVDAPGSQVFTSPILGSNWTLVPYLYCDRLKVCAAPDTDEATLFYRYGPMLREPRGTADAPNYESSDLKQYDPLDMKGMYCKVVIPGIGFNNKDKVWYGIIEVEEQKPEGSNSNSIVQTLASGKPDPDDVSEPRGTQHFTAYGLIRLLELTTLTQSVVRHVPNSTNSDETSTLGFALPFNSYRPGEYKDRGNRSTYSYSSAVGPDQAGSGAGTSTGLNANPAFAADYFIFSDIPQRTRSWNAAHAAKYLLSTQAPLDGQDQEVCNWRITAGPDDADATKTLGWYDVTVHCDKRSLKHALDELISRKRGVGYHITYSEDDPDGGSRGCAFVRVFSFNNTVVDFASDDPTSTGSILPNPNCRSLNFENSFDITPKIVNSICSQYDRVVAYGEFKTSTFTLSLDPIQQQISPDWTAAEEAFYKTAASGDADYAGLQLPDQQKRNTRYRQLDQIRHVYRRFQIADVWPQYTFDYDDGSVPKQLIAPELDGSTGEPVNGGVFNPETKEPGDAIWNKGLTILSRLPLKDRFDYSGTVIDDGTAEETTVTGESADDIDGEPAFLRPIFFVKQLVDGALQRWVLLERFSDFAVFQGGGQWSASVSILDQRPAFEINLNSAPQHFIATTDFAGAATFNYTDDPDTHGGIDFADIRCTICVKLFDRVSESVTVDSDVDAYALGPPKRVLYIHVSDARLDYVVPSTTVGLKNGLIQQSTGGFVRDDRDRLQRIARAAAEWYGRPRQTIEIEMKQIREVVRLGWLITDVGPNYQLEHVNTPVTSIQYDLLNSKTTFQTAHAEIEFE